VASEIGAAKRITDRMVPAEAVPAGVARNVVGCNDPVSPVVAIYSFSCFNNLSGNLVAKDQGCPLEAIPLHHVATADATGLYPKEQFTRANPGCGHLLYTDVLIIVIHGHAHVSDPLNHPLWKSSSMLCLSRKTWTCQGTTGRFFSFRFSVGFCASWQKVL
jgi:hypothetical protein